MCSTHLIDKKEDEMVLSIEELNKLEKGSYQLIDIRDEDAYQHGFIPGAIHMDMDEIRLHPERLDKEKKIIL